MKLIIELEIENENPEASKEVIFLAITNEIPNLIISDNDTISIESIKMYRF